MLHINKAMLELLIKHDCALDEATIMQCNDYVDSLHIVDECVIRNGSAGYDWNIILKNFGDYTGFEMSCNEERFFAGVDNCNGRIVLKTFRFLSCLISNKFPNLKFQFCMSSDGNAAVFRFHKVRENELPWLATDIDLYDEAVIYMNSEEMIKRVTL